MNKRLAKVAYRPIGLGASIAAGAIASMLFRQIWQRIDRESDAPDALDRDQSIGKVLLAAMLQGAIFAAVKAGIDRGGARIYQRATGTWPGN